MCVNEAKDCGKVYKEDRVYKDNPSGIIRNPEIFSYINMIQERMNTLEKSIVILRDKIEPVLSNRPRVESPDKEVEIMESPTTAVGEKLHLIYQQSKVLNNMVLYIRDSVEV
jgi:hypothetical protein